MAIVIRKNGALNALTAGLAEGLPQGVSMGIAARRQRSEEERYRTALAQAAERTELDRQAGARAERAMGLAESREAREAGEYEQATARRAAADEGAQALAQWRTDYTGPDQAVGQGMDPFRDLEA